MRTIRPLMFPPASVHFAVKIFFDVVQIRFFRQRLPGEIRHLDVYRAFVALTVICRGGIGFPVQIARLVNRSVEVQIKMTALERAVLQNLMAVMGAVTDIVMQDELVNRLLEFFVSCSQILNLIFRVFAGGCAVQLRIVLRAVAPSSGMRAGVTLGVVPKHNGRFDIYGVSTRHNGLVRCHRTPGEKGECGRSVTPLTIPISGHPPVGPSEVSGGVLDNNFCLWLGSS
jgi:hypothetical protein